MRKQLESIVSECISRNIPVQAYPLNGKCLSYQVQGFSKSGVARIYVHKNKILCETRYSHLEEIDSFQDLAMVALEWYLNYKDRSPFEEPESYWAEYWVEKGIMVKSTKTCYSLK